MYNAYPSVASTSLSASGTIAEEMYPLWMHSSGTTTSTSGTVGNMSLAAKGQQTCASSGALGTKLLTLSSSWSASQKFALEVSVYSSSASYTVTAQLYDFTASAAVSGSAITSTATTATLLRSGSVTLIPGRIYGVSLTTTGGTANLTKAHLVALEM